MRKVLIGIAVLLVVLVAAAFVVPRFIPADSLKADIAAQVRDATGRDLIIDGDLSFTLLPAPGVSVSGVRISNVAGAQAADMVQLKSAQVEVALGPLFAGNIEIERVVLVEPVFELEQFADGTNNWSFPAAEPAADGAGDNRGESGGASGFGGSVQLNDLVVRDGVVVFRSPELTERIDAINASFGAASLRGPFRVDGEMTARGMAARMRGSIGALQSDHAVPVNLTAGAGDTDVTFSGLLSGLPDDARIAGDFETTADDLAALIATVTGAPAPAGLADRALAVKGKLSATAQAAALNDLTVTLGDISATGAANAVFGAPPAVDLILNIGQIDLNRMLADARTQPGGKGGLAVPAKEAGGGGPAPAGSPAFALPDGLNATIEAKADAVLFRDGVIRQAALNAQLSDGELTISQLTAQLPGSADVSLFGFVTARDGVAKFGGQGEANADDLRGLLSWLGVDVSAVPLDRLRKLALTAKVDGVPDKLDITEIDLGVDGSRIRGGVAVALRDRLGLGIGLSLDQLNIDAYLPPDAAPAPAPAAGQRAPSAGTDRAAPATAANTGLAVLDRFDSDVRFKAGKLTFRGKSIQGLNIDGTLTAGTLALREASVSSLAGASAKASGQISRIASPAPTVDLDLDIDAKESDRLLEMLAAAPSFTVGPARLRGTVKGNLDTLNLDLALAALGAEIETKGKVLKITGAPEFDLSVDLSHGDATAFVSRLSGSGKTAEAGRSAGALRIAAAATGNFVKSAFSADINVGAGSFAVKGQLAEAGTPQMAGGVALSGDHPDLAGAVRLFAPDYRPALAAPGPLKFSTDLAFDPTTLRFDNLRGNAGPVAFESNANVALGGPRPRVSGELKTSEIIVDWFLPVPKQSASARGPGGGSGGGARQPAPAAAGAARWSNERLDLSALHRIDADIALTAPAITYTDLRIDQPKVKVNLAEGVLDLNELSGRAYGGGFNMTGRVVAKDVPSVRYALAIDGADAARFTGAAGGQQGRGVMSVLDLLFPVSNVKLASGTLGAKIDVASQGRSERELVGALSGQGDVTFTDAVAEGVDVCRISNQLDNLNGLEGFLGLVLSAQGGSTRIQNYAGRFDIARGIATLPQQRINADCATVDVAGTVDLPRWLIDVQARALFPQHPKFPGVIVEQKGPLDLPNTRLVNSNQVQQYIIGKSAGSILRKVLPDNQRQPATQGTTGGQPAPEPTDQIRGLLKDLLQNR